MLLDLLRNTGSDLRMPVPEEKLSTKTSATLLDHHSLDAQHSMERGVAAHDSERWRAIKLFLDQ